MLTRGVLLAGLPCLLAAGPIGVASATPTPPPPVVVSGDNNSGTVDTTVTAPGLPSAPNHPTGSSSSDAGNGITCVWTAESAYSQQLFVELGSDPNGTWYDVSCSDGSVTLGVYVPPASGNVPPAVVLAGTLAQTAANSLQLPAPRAARSPAGQALVGLATWFWVDPAQWQPLTQRTTAGPVWAEVTATPVSTTWDPGDGMGVLACSGPGTPYDRTRPEAQQSTDCSHTYRRSSADQPQTGPQVNDRFFTVTVTATWQITWRGPAGSGGTLAPLTRQSTFALPVAQRQTVVTSGSG
ncbi:MAG: hypothetical protein JWM02_1305 [Frankiales bacterium]|nr:hypothetical protein [Frankiales bacterium]